MLTNPIFFSYARRKQLEFELAFAVWAYSEQETQTGAVEHS